MTDVTLAELAAALISSFEGPPPMNKDGLYIPFQDGGGVWTIGKGHTPGVTESTPPATQAQVDAWFAADQAPLFTLVRGIPLLEAAALVSFGFNCGSGALQEVLAGRGVIFHYMHDSKGNVEPGLVTRRNLEGLLMSVSQQLTGKAA